jgi:hypothetical protein
VFRLAGSSTDALLGIDQGAERLAREPPRQALERPLRLKKQFDIFMSDFPSRFGFVDFAETWNGRLAMLGFVIGLATELLTGQGILSQLGLG